MKENTQNLAQFHLSKVNDAQEKLLKLDFCLLRLRFFHKATFDLTFKCKLCENALNIKY